MRYFQKIIIFIFDYDLRSFLAILYFKNLKDYFIENSHSLFVCFNIFVLCFFLKLNKKMFEVIDQMGNRYKFPHNMILTYEDLIDHYRLQNDIYPKNSVLSIYYKKEKIVPSNSVDRNQEAPFIIVKENFSPPECNSEPSDLQVGRFDHFFYSCYSSFQNFSSASKNDSMSDKDDGSSEETSTSPYASSSNDLMDMEANDIAITSWEPFDFFFADAHFSDFF